MYVAAALTCIPKKYKINYRCERRCLFDTVYFLLTLVRRHVLCMSVERRHKMFAWYWTMGLLDVAPARVLRRCRLDGVCIQAIASGRLVADLRFEISIWPELNNTIEARIWLRILISLHLYVGTYVPYLPMYVLRTAVYRHEKVSFST